MASTNQFSGSFGPATNATRLQVPLLAATATIAIAAATVARQKGWIGLLVSAAILLVFVWPVQAALGAYGFLIPFNDLAAVGAQSEGTTLNFFVGAGACVVLLGTAVIRGRWVQPPRALMWWIFFLCWAVGTYFWSVDQQIAYERLFTAICLLGVYTAAVCISIRRQEYLFIAGLVVLGAVAAAFYEIWLFNRGVFFMSSTMRGSLVSGDRQSDPNVFAVSLLLPVAFALGAFFQGKKPSHRLAGLVAAGVLTVGIFLTMSRGALLSLMVVVVYYAWRLRKKFGFVILCLCLALPLLALPQLFFTRLQTATDTGGAGRLDIWMAGTVALRHYAIQGAGMGNFNTAYQEFSGDAPQFKGSARAPHNIYLGLGVETGLLGLILMLAGFRSQLAGSLRRYRQRFAFSIPCEAACWGMLAAGCFVDILWSKAFWLCWMMLTAARRLDSQTEPA